MNDYIAIVILAVGLGAGVWSLRYVYKNKKESKKMQQEIQELRQKP